MSTIELTLLTYLPVDIGAPGISIIGPTGADGVPGSTGPKGDKGAPFKLDYFAYGITAGFFNSPLVTTYCSDFSNDQQFAVVVESDNRGPSYGAPFAYNLTGHLILYDCEIGKWNDVGPFTAITGPTGPAGAIGKH